MGRLLPVPGWWVNQERKCMRKVGKVQNALHIRAVMTWPKGLCSSGQMAALGWDFSTETAGLEKQLQAQPTSCFASGIIKGVEVGGLSSWVPTALPRGMCVGWNIKHSCVCILSLAPTNMRWVSWWWHLKRRKGFWASLLCSLLSAIRMSGILKEGK